MFTVANCIMNIILTISISLNSNDVGIQQILVSAIRFFCGVVSNVYSSAFVLGNLFKINILLDYIDNFVLFLF